MRLCVPMIATRESIPRLPGEDLITLNARFYDQSFFEQYRIDSGCDLPIELLKNSSMRNLREAVQKAIMRERYKQAYVDFGKSSVLDRVDKRTIDNYIANP